jgi:hypothetical protein
MTRKVLVKVLALPFTFITSYLILINSRRRGYFFASAIFAFVKLIRQMFNIVAFLLIVTNSIIILNLSLYASGIIHSVFAPDSFNVAIISFTFLGLYAIIVTLSF